MDYLKKIVAEIEVHSVNGIKECFEQGISPNDFYNNEALIYEQRINRLYINQLNNRNSITMRKLIMWNVITLDGYFEGKQNWDLDFHNLIWGKELEQLSIEQLTSADCLVFGRVTYEGMAAYWKTETGEIAELMNKTPKLVFSRTLTSVDWENSILVNGDAAAEISRRKSEGNGDMYLFGSAILSETFMNGNLFDELRIGIAPVVLGNGRPLFSQEVDTKTLSLISSENLSTGGVLLKYKPNA